MITQMSFEITSLGHAMCLRDQVPHHCGTSAVGVATARFRLTAIYETVENGWIQARVEELPGVITVAPDRARAEEFLLDALREYLLALPDAPQPQADGEPAPAQRGALEVTLSA